jgi:hypothetical protein
VIFDRSDLQDRGFVGFVPVAELPDREPQQVPPDSGVYVVVRTSLDAPVFLEQGQGSWFKNKDPNVPIAKLAAKWVADTTTLYLGMAGSLRERVGLLVEFSRAGHKPVFHWGGRHLWQVEGNQDMLVAWTPEPLYEGYEDKLIEEFLGTYGRFPFANLRRGNRNAPRPSRR